MSYPITSTKPSPPGVKVQTGLELFLRALNRQVKNQPEDARGYRARGWVLSNVVNGPGAQTAALNDYNRVLELEPEQNGNFYFQRGRLLYRMNHPVRAIRDLSRTVDLNPEATHAYIFRARAYGSLGKLARSSQDLDKAIQLKPGLAEAFGLRGLLRMRQRRKSAALLDLARAVRLDPDSEYRLDLGWARLHGL